ncbi:MAG: MGDG synthase family glycosyltransferase [Candidatus Dormibacteria bacterium]
MAAALQAALRSEAGPGLRAEIADPLRSGALPQASLVLKGYGPLVRRAPAAWGPLFAAFSRPAAGALLEGFLLSGLRTAMVRRARRTRPRVVVNLHPLLGPGALAAASAVGAPLMTLVTDLTLVHPGWLSPRGIHLLTPSDEATSSCLSQGVPAGLVETTGLPLDPELERARPSSGLRQELGLEPELPCLLVSGGAEGAGGVERVLREVEESRVPCQVALLCGRNGRLLRWATGRSWHMPVHAFPFMEDPGPLILSADLYLGKAGPTAIGEAASAGLGMILTSALRGQEQANLDWAVRRGVALAAVHPGDVAKILPEVLGADGAVLERLRRAAHREMPPGAATRAAVRILELAGITPR